ncbi:LptF/LptG family permease [Entomobacter blattae]
MILAALMEILTLLEATGQIIHRHLGVKGVLLYASLRFPLLLGFSLPISILIGALITFSRLTINNEIAILRGTGLSTLQLVKLLLPATLGLGILCALINDQITPRAELALATWWNKTDLQPEKAKPFWFRSKNRLVKIGFIQNGGKTINNISIYNRDENKTLTQIIHAKTALFEQNHWILNKTHAVDITVDAVTESKDTADTITLLPSPPPLQRVDLGISPQEMVFLSMDHPPYSIRNMLRAISGNLPSRLPESYFFTSLLDRLLLPISFLVMLLLALPVIYIPPRTGTRSWLPVWCLGGGLLFIVFQGILRALGAAGTLPSFLAIIPGIIIFSLAITTILLRIEEK